LEAATCLLNFCPTAFAQLSHHARHALRMRKRLVIAFGQQAELFPMLTCIHADSH
jgi:hypothetical protein